MTNGFWNQLIRINLTNYRIDIESIPEELYEKFLGGSGLATKYLYDEVPSRTNALAPENKVIFATGPFQGSGIPGSAKWAVVSRSPLTGTFAVSTAGAEWGVRLKRAGYDLLIIEGRSEKPVYIWINNHQIKIKPAEHLWGKDAIETVGLIRKEIGDSEVSVAAIGPAGEKKVGIASIVVDTHSFAGRCGFGAVLGSKGLKAVAVKGSKSVSVARMAHLKELNKVLFKTLSQNTKDTMRAHGTAASVTSCEAIGDLPIKYWNQAVWTEGAAKIGAPNYTERLKARSWPCIYCPVGCHRQIIFEYNGELIEGAGAEYESLGMLGSNCLIDDLFAISKANDLCNRLGIDTISAGAYVAFTMECFEKGLISKTDLDGREARWGDGEFLIDLIKQIGGREGYGALFAEGIRPAASKVGKEAEQLIVEVKNLDFPAHDPRAYFSLAINYATGTRGACHLRGYPHIGEAGRLILPEIGLTKPPERFNMMGQARLAALFQDLAALHDSLVICIFIPINGLSLNDTVKLLNFITGRKSTPKGVMQIGERIVTLQRQINLNDSLGYIDDRLPQKMFIPAESGFRKDRIPEPFNETLLEFYEYRGWDQNGKPKQEKLKELGLS